MREAAYPFPSIALTSMMPVFVQNAIQRELKLRDLYLSATLLYFSMRMSSNASVHVVLWCNGTALYLTSGRLHPTCKKSEMHIM